jgi:hypothetical protein
LNREDLEGVLQVLLIMDDFETYKVVGLVCVRYQVDPDKHHKYLDKLLAQYKGLDTPENLSNWLDTQIPKLFRAIDKRPFWIQSPHWLFSKEGEPMIFIGQIDINMVDKPLSERLYHDDTTFYLFTSETGEYGVVKQQY